LFNYIAYFCLAFFIASVLTPLVKCLAKGCCIVDHPDEDRKVHEHVKPRLGGAAIAMSFLFCLVITSVYDGDTSALFSPLSDGNTADVLQSHPFGLRFFIGALIIFLLGAWDDWKGTNAKTKFFWQIVAALIVIVGQPKFGILTGFGFTGTIFTVVDIGIGVFWVAYLCNAFNLIDGLDGLSAGTTFFSCIGLCMLAFSIGKTALAMLIILLAGAVLAFLQYNRFPAQIFMGDSGSLFVGFCLSIFSLNILSSGILSGMSFLAPFVALGLPLLDTTWAIVRRYASGKGLFSADKGHIHHLMMAKSSHNGAVNRLYIVNLLLLVAVGIIARFPTELGIWGHITIYGLVIFGAYVLLIQLKKSPQLPR
jgi:UDP-GlcNAc:undecaprenyl-phosphate GlcNAc-1-phosphate transferase